LAGNNAHFMPSNLILHKLLRKIR